MGRRVLYTGCSMQVGSALPGHMLDITLGALVLASSMTGIAPPDYGAISAASMGSLAGGLIAAVMFRDQRVRLEVMWGVSFLIGVVFGPAVFDWLSLPVVGADGQVLASATIRRDANALIALSGALSILGWGTLKKAYLVWLALVEHRLKRRFGDADGAG